MNGAISDIVAQALGPFILSYEWWIFPRSVRSPAFPIQSSTLETKNWWRVWSPSFVFECWAFLLESSWAAQVLCVSSWTLKLEYSAYTLACLKISMENLLNEVLEFDVSLLMQFLKCEILRSVQVVYRLGYLPFFFCAVWHNIVLFIRSLGFSLAESCQKFGQRSRWGGPTPIANWLLPHGNSSALLSEFCCEENRVFVSL